MDRQAECVGDILFTTPTPTGFAFHPYAVKKVKSNQGNAFNIGARVVVW